MFNGVYFVLVVIVLNGHTGTINIETIIIITIWITKPSYLIGQADKYIADSTLLIGTVQLLAVGGS